MTIKPIHGAPVPLWQRFGLQEIPPEPCPFTVGDRVIYTNEYGVKFDEDVVGFSKDSSFQGGFIHIVRHGTDGDGNAWWYPHHPSVLVMHPDAVRR